MNELDDLKYNCTRRHFLSSASLGLGATALASLLLDPAIAASAPPAPADGAAAGGPLLASPHFVPRVKRVIYLFQSGGPSQLELFDYKPLLRTMNGAGAAGVGAHGAAAHRHDRVPEVVPDGRLAVRVRAARQVRRVGQRAACRTRRGSSTSCASSSRCTPRRSTTIPAVTFFQTGFAAGRPARRWAPGSPTASARRTRTCPRSSSCSRGRARATSRSTRGCGAAASCRRSIRACSSAAARIRCCT